MMGAGNSGRNWYNRNESGSRLRKTSGGPNYQQHRTERSPPLISLNCHTSNSQAAPSRPHFSEVTRNKERSEWQHEVQDYRRYHPDDFNDSDDDDGREGYPYANNYHQNMNNARRSSSASMHELEYRRYHREYTRGRQSQGQSAQSVSASGSRVRKTSDGPNYQQHRTEGQPQLMSINCYVSNSQAAPSRPHFSEITGNKESSEWQHEVQDYRRYDPYDLDDTDDDDGREGYPYANNYHQNLNNARRSSSASMHELEYRRYHREYTRGRQSQGQSPQSVRTPSSGPPQAYRGRSASVYNNTTSSPSKERLDCRKRNTSTGKNWTRFSTNDDTFICPTCGQIIGLQIYKCRNEHNSCKNCKNNCHPCGICGDDITRDRNITMERNLAKRSIQCPHYTRGCKLAFKVTEIESHIKECPFQELQCPLGCHWRGKVQEICAHFDGFHVEQRSVNVASEVKLRDLSKNSQNVYLITIGYFNFFFHVKSSVKDRRIYMAVQLIGTKCSALKWSYEVHVYNKNESRRECILTDVCTSFVEPVDILYKKGQGSVLNHTYASTFINNGFLTYKIYITKQF